MTDLGASSRRYVGDETKRWSAIGGLVSFNRQGSQIDIWCRIASLGRPLRYVCQLYYQNRRDRSLLASTTHSKHATVNEWCLGYVCDNVCLSNLPLRTSSMPNYEAEISELVRLYHPQTHVRMTSHALEQKSANVHSRTWHHTCRWIDLANFGNAAKRFLSNENYTHF